MSDLLTTSFLSAISGSAVDVLFNIANQRLIVAKNDFQARQKKEQTVVKISMQSRFEKLNKLQAKAILELPDSELLKKVLTITIELTAQLYETSVEKDFETIDQRISQLEAIIDRDNQDRKARQRIRVYAVSVSIIVFIGLFIFAFNSSSINVLPNYLIPFFQVPLAVFFWSAIGSFSSLIYRFNKSSDDELQDPLRWLITRPLIGIIMGSVVFLVIKTGYLTLGSTDISTDPNELIYLVSFLVGFSDQFTEGILKNLIGKLGGDRDKEITMPISNKPRLNLAEMLQALPTLPGRILNDKSQKTDQGINEGQLVTEKGRDSEIKENAEKNLDSKETKKNK
jgi:hypothetical protein